TSERKLGTSAIRESLRSVLESTKSLNLRLLIDAEDDGAVRRIQIRRDDIPHFVDKPRVLRQLERFDAVPVAARKARPMRTTAAHRHRHRAGTPVCGVGWRRL